jgi:hypothetical protein
VGVTVSDFGVPGELVARLADVDMKFEFVVRLRHAAQRMRLHCRADLTPPRRAVLLLPPLQAKELGEALEVRRRQGPGPLPVGAALSGPRQPPSRSVT